MMNWESKRVDVDVLVIGSGMAGRHIEAKRAGQDVLLVDKVCRTCFNSIMQVV